MYSQARKWGCNWWISCLSIVSLYFIAGIAVGGDFEASLKEMLGLTTPRSAIESVLAKDKALSADARKDSDGVHRYAKSIISIDLSQCPEDFQDVFRAHANAWYQLAKRIADQNKAPSGFFDAYYKLFFSPYETELVADEVKESWNKVKAVAAKYGVTVADQ